jgi:hypothetical protein
MHLRLQFALKGLLEDNLKEVLCLVIAFLLLSQKAVF